MNNKWVKKLLSESVEFYLESNGTDVEILLNPSYNEINKTLRDSNRGWITPTGDLYMEGDALDKYSNPIPQDKIIENEFFLIHKDIYQLLMRHNKVEHHSGPTMSRNIMDSSTNGFGVIRNNRSNKLRIGESYTQQVKDDYQERFKEVIKKFKKKNPEWVFI